jgi:hypothetical protein
MSYEVAPIDVTGKKEDKVIDPRSKKDKRLDNQPYKWWNAQDDKELVAQLLSTTEYLKRTNMNRIRQASIFARLFGGKPLYNFLASNSTLDSSNQLPIGRPTANVVYSCTDTLVSRISQDRPKPIFLTDGGHYKERKLAKMANQFIQGELYRTKAYDLGALALRDACVLGNGFIKVFTKDKKVCLERVLETELLTDFNDAYYGNPRQLIHIKLVDRSVFIDTYPDAEDAIAKAVHGNVDSTPRSTDTITDQIIVSEGWHLPSSKDSDDGRHVIVCSEGVIIDEKWEKEKFPFVNFGYNPNIVGYFSQGLAEILMPSQMEIYRLLIIDSQSMELMGVPRIWMDEMSKILETSFNNRIGTIIKGRGAPPEFISPDAGLGDRVGNRVIWLIQNCYQMSGISAMSAAGQKPAGLNSGEAIRSFDQIQEDRFAALARRYQNIYPELSYMILEEAHDIAEEEGSYLTVYPGRDGTREIDLKHLKGLTENPIIQCYEESSLPKDPAGRQAKLSEMLAAGEITNQEFRRLSNFPDLEQSDQLATALEERILHALDEIVENGDKNYVDIMPDNFILDPTDMATTLCVNYINLYSTLELEEAKMQVLRNWFTQIQNLKQAAQPPPMQQPMPAQGQAPQVAPPQQSIAPTSNVAV